MNDWKYRPPPEGEKTFKMCDKAANCWYGDSCINAHSTMELDEWNRRRRKQQYYGVQHNLSEVDTFAEQLLKELMKAKAENRPENTLIVEVGSGYSIMCNEKMFIPHIPRGKEVTWQFTIKSSIPSKPCCLLKNIYTLDPYLPEFCLTSIKMDTDVNEDLNPGTQLWSNNGHPPAAVVQITVKFVSSNFGKFCQRLIFDFGQTPKIYRNLGVNVAPEESLVKSLQYRPVCTEDSELAWLERYPFVPFEPGETVWSVKKSRQYPLPPNMANAVCFGSFDHLDVALTPGNYKERLHTLLYIEEYERRRQLTRLNLHCDDIFEVLKKSQENPALRAVVLPIEEHMIDDASMLIKRSSRALIKLYHPSFEDTGKEEVLFESVVEDIKTDKVVLQISGKMQTALGDLVHQSAVPVDVCFRFVDTYQAMHKAVDTIDLNLVFPSNRADGKARVRSHPSHKELNGPQATAMKEMVDPHSKAPVLLLGPFGTGKTRTIAEAVKELIRRPGNHRILICTHSNSAADHYIDDYFHPIFNASKMARSAFRPLRICWQHRFSSAMSDNVLRYCLVDQKTGKFCIPSLEQIHSHRIVVTTLVTADELLKAGIKPGYFTHIFIDEAAQAMEVETIIPLCLANQDTKIVMAGDHLQLSPMVMSVIAKKLHLNRSLLVRLHDCYSANSSSKVHLIENYRSYKEIVDIPSKLFYGNTLIARRTRPAGIGYPVHFYGVLGSEEWSKDQPSYYNMAEVAELVERVEQLVHNWPEAWGEIRQFNICALAPYVAQIREIRKHLRFKQLGGVRVESVNSVQGLEFDALFISTVRTYNTMTAETLDRSDLGFLSDPKLLNTAVTRAKYHLCIVGDPNALCAVGLSKVCWKTILAKCDENGTYNYRLPFNKVIKIIRGTIDAPSSEPVDKHISYSCSDSRVPLLNGADSHSIRMVPPTFQSYRSEPSGKTPRFHRPQSSSAAQPLHGFKSSLSGFPAQSLHGLSLQPGFQPPDMQRSTPAQLLQGFQFSGGVPQPQGHYGNLPNFQLPHSGKNFDALSTINVLQQSIRPNVLPVAPLSSNDRIINPNFVSVQNSGPAGLQSRFNPPFPNSKQKIHAMSPEWGRFTAEKDRILSPVSSQMATSTADGRRDCQQAASVKLNEAALISSINQDKHQKDVSGCKLGHTSLQFLTKIKSNLEKRKRCLSNESGEIIQILAENKLDDVVLPQEALSKLECSLSLLKEEEKLVERRLVLMEQTVLDTEGMVRELSFSSDTPLALAKRDESLNNSTRRKQGVKHSPITTIIKQENLADSPGSVRNNTQEPLLDISDDDLLNFDSDEWFEARRKDPIVQDYIKTFELLMSQPQTTLTSLTDETKSTKSEQKFQLPSDSVFNEEDFPALGAASNAVSKRALTPFDVGQWVLQPSTASVYVEQQPIHEEYLREDEVELLIKSGDLVKCTLQIDERSGGNTAIAKVDDPSFPDVYIGNRINMNRAFHGDVVAVKLLGVPHQDPVLKGKVVSIMTEVHHREVVCRPDLTDRNIMVPINKTNPRFVVLQSKDDEETETVGKLFVVKLTKWGANYRYPLGFLVKYMNEGTNCRLALPVLLAESGIRPRPPKQVVTEFRRLYPKTWQIPEQERKRRPLYKDAITLDPEGSLELDDAITAKKEGESYLVGVHVSDVSYFVAKDSIMDESAAIRGMSVHPDPKLIATLPMFPSELASELCSLVVGKDCLAITVMFTLNDDGKMIGVPNIHRSIVCSRSQMSYEQCGKILNNDFDGDVDETVQGTLAILSHLTRRMTAIRVRNGSLVGLDIGSSSEYQARNIVEELMLQANIAVAHKLLAYKGTRNSAPLRRQLPPKDAALTDLHNWCASHGFATAHCFTLNRIFGTYPPQDYSANLDVADWERVSMAMDTKDHLRLTQAMLRQNQHSDIATAFAQLNAIQERSEYVIAAHTCKNFRRHFSLAVDCYTHFTSPLRRYFDVVVHRMLIAALERTASPYSADELRRVCLQSNSVAVRVESFEKQSAGVSIAATLGTGKRWKVATVDLVSADNLEFSTRSQGLNLLHQGVQVHDLKASSRDWLTEEKQLSLTWNVLEADCSTSDLTADDRENQSFLSTSPLSATVGGGVARSQLTVPNRLWTAFVKAFVCEDYKKLNEIRAIINKESVLKLKDTSMDTSHESVSISLSDVIQPKWIYRHFYCKQDKVTLLIGSEVRRGILQPAVDGIHLGRSLVCCIRHQRKPAECFGQPLCEKAKDSYSDVKDYQAVMEPLLVNESAMKSASAETCHVIVKGLSLSWLQDAGQGVVGQFVISKLFCSAHSIQFSVGDFLCIRYSPSGSRVSVHDPGQVTQDTDDSQMTVQVFHCRVVNVSGLETDRNNYDVKVRLVEPKICKTQNILAAAGVEMACTVQLIPQWLSYRRMISAIQQLHSASELVRNVFLRRNVPQYLARHMSHAATPKVQGQKLDSGQQMAVTLALKSPLVLIQGPPGTGKTWTAVAIVRQFISMNKMDGDGRSSHVLYCGPSNQSVDVAAKMLGGMPEVKMLRVYGRTIESQSFPLISQMGVSFVNSQQAVMDKTLKDVSLHYRIRKSDNPHSAALLQLEKEIIHLKKRQERKGDDKELSDKINQYRQVLEKAERFEIAENGVNLILCTCTEAASPRLRKHALVKQCIIDECSMCMEPECLVTMMAAGQRCQRTVLIGDHKQLSPIVMSNVARKLGLSRSLFGILFENRSSKAYSSYMLQKQYRMHPSIRKFPSKQFYNNKLEDASEVTAPKRLRVGAMAMLWPAGPDVRLVFCHVKGEEQSPQDFTGLEGREDSKFNEMEVEKTVDIIKFIRSCGIEDSQISVFTPYTAQKVKIAKALNQAPAEYNVETLSVYASQGSERDFVVISTVRSLPENEILSEASQQWMALHLGFLTDEHQINVAITRARHGLFIVGNKHLLAVHSMWNSLLEHYSQQRCIVEGTQWPPIS